MSINIEIWKIEILYILKCWYIEISRILKNRYIEILKCKYIYILKLIYRYRNIEISRIMKYWDIENIEIYWNNIYIEILDI